MSTDLDLYPILAAVESQASVAGWGKTTPAIFVIYRHGEFVSLFFHANNPRDSPIGKTSDYTAQSIVSDHIIAGKFNGNVVNTLHLLAHQFQIYLSRPDGDINERCRIVAQLLRYPDCIAIGILTEAWTRRSSDPDAAPQETRLVAAIDRSGCLWEARRVAGSGRVLNRQEPGGQIVPRVKGDDSGGRYTGTIPHSLRILAAAIWKEDQP